MSERFDFDEFLSQFNLKPSSLETDSKVTYGNLVLGEYGMDTTVFPMRVLQVLETPRGPTEFQEGVVGCILPYIPLDEDEGGSSFDMDTGALLPERTETLIIHPYGYVNSILLALLNELSVGNRAGATKKAQYIQAICGFLQGSRILALSPEEGSLDKPFVRFGNMTTPNQLKNPYSHQDSIFSK